MNNTLKFIASCRLPTEWGDFTMHGFEEPSGQEHIALTMGDFSDDLPVLTRIHSECLTGDALFSKKCDCGPQLEAAMKAVQQEGRGVIVYLRQEGRGIGLINKIRAYKLQDEGMDTVEANLALGLPVDARDFTLAKQIYDHLNICAVKLLTNNPEKNSDVERCRHQCRRTYSAPCRRECGNERYLHTKADKLGHMIFD